MEQFRVELQPDLDQVAGTRVLEGTLETEGYRVGSEQYLTPNGVDYNVTLTNTGEGILLQGSVRCDVQGTCARCLEPVDFDLEGEVEGYYLLEPADEVEGYEEDEFECVDEDGSFDIAGQLEAALVFATPYQTLCDDDCKGLCPKCGANLNEGPCACDADDIDDDNPFAALKNLKFD